MKQKTADTLIEPEDIVIEGCSAHFVQEKIPAYEAIPLVGDMMKNLVVTLPESTIAKLLSYVYVELNGQYCALDNAVVVNQHVKDPYWLYVLYFNVVKRNFSFLTDGRLQTLLEMVAPVKKENSEDENSDIETLQD